MELSAKDIVTLRDALSHSTYDKAIAGNAILNRLSPPEPEQPDEATVWTRKVLHAEYEITAYATGEMDKHDKFINARQVLSELIATKDAEIEQIVKREIGTVDQLEATLPELAALRAEIERLKADNMPPEGYTNLYIAARDCIFDANKLGRIEDGWLLLENVNVSVALKAAERNTAEPEHRLSGESNLEAGEVVRSTDSRSSDGSGNRTPNDIAKEYLPRLLQAQEYGEPTQRAILGGLILEAEARGRREALEASIAKMDAASDLVGPSNRKIIASVFNILRDELKRMMTEWK